MKYTKSLFSIVSIIALGVLLSLGVNQARAVSPAQLDIDELLGSDVSLTAATATNIYVSHLRVLKIEKGQDLGVQFNFKPASTSTGRQIAYFQYRMGSGAPWSTAVVGATNVANTTLQVCSTITLTNGVSFPNTASEMRLFFLTNEATVTVFHTNVLAGTYKTK